MTSRIDHAYLRSAIAEGGGGWVGIQNGERECLVLFKDPVTQNGLSMRVDDVTAEAVRAKLQAQRDMEIRYLGRLKPLVTSEDLVNQAKARERNHAFWARQYTFERRAKNIFFGMMTLLLLLAVAIPWILILYEKVRRP
jgi:hypothetical protein